MKRCARIKVGVVINALGQKLELSLQNTWAVYAHTALSPESTKTTAAAPALPGPSFMLWGCQDFSFFRLFIHAICKITPSPVLSAREEAASKTHRMVLLQELRV